MTAACGLLLATPLVQAQAWLPPKDAFSVSLTYNDTLNLKHYLPDGDEFDAGHTRTDAYGLSLHTARLTGSC